MADCLTEKFGISLSWEYNFTKMQKKRLFSEFVCSQYQGEICSAIENYATENPDLFNLKIIESVSEVECDSIDSKKIWIRDLPKLSLEFDLALAADLNFTEHTRRRDEEEPITQWLLVSGSVDFASLNDGLTISEVQLYEARFNADSDYTDSLSPCIYDKDTERIAQKFLSQYYPEALKTACEVDVDTVVRRMGLKVEIRHLSSDLHVFGQILFKKSKTEVYPEGSSSPIMEEFSGGTILIDDRVFFLRNYGSIRHTILHECIHWYLHRKTFLLAMLLKQAESGFKCCISGHMQSREQSNDAWFLEWQANKIAAKVLVPEKTLKQKVNQYLAEQRELFPSLADVYLMKNVVKMVADFFSVSVLVAQIRMLECDFSLAVGAVDYCDGRYLKPYAFKKDSLAENETYTIGCQDLIIEKLKNSDLRSLMDNAQLIYSDSHLVLNSPKYVENKKLTEYARLHLDECAIKFSSDMNGNRKGEGFYRECILFHGYNGDIQVTCKFKKEANEDIISRAEAILQQQQYVNELFECLVMTSFAQTLNKLMEKQGLTIKDLADKSGISEKQITRLRKGKTENPELETVVALAIGLDVPKIVSMEFLKIAGYKLRRDKQEHLMYDFFLDDVWSPTVAECNEILAAMNFKPLTKED